MLKNKINFVYSKFNKFYLIKIFSSFLIQISSLFLVYLLSAEEYGNLSLLMSISSLMFVFTSGWNNGAIINLGSKNFAEKGYYNHIVFYRLIIILVCLISVSIFFLFYKEPIISFLHFQKNYLLAFILYIGLVSYDFSYQLLYPGNKDILQSLLELFYSTILVICMFLWVRNIENYVYTLTSISLLFTIVTNYYFIKFYKHNKFKFNLNEFNTVLSYSLWQIISIIGIYVINVGMNYIFVYNEILTIDIGQYNFSFKLFSGFSVFFALFGILIPKWVNRNEDLGIGQTIIKRIYLISIFLSIIYLLIAVSLKPFIILVNKLDYLESSNYFIFLFPAFLFMCFSNLLNTVVANTVHYKYSQYILLLQVILLIIISIPLVNYFQIYGAIIALTISYFFSSILFYILFKTRILILFK